MNFENLKGLLGEAYHEGITADEVNNFFAGKNFADLSTGQYVDKAKHDREVQSLNATITEKTNALNAKLTDDEKATQARDADKKEIQRLTELLKQNTLTSNKNLATSSMANIKTVLGLKDDDADYNSFIDNIISEDADKTSLIAKYVAKLTNDAYEKGKKDAVKDSMGKFGKQAKGEGSDGGKEDNDLGKRLAKQSLTGSTQTIDYFKR